MSVRASRGTAAREVAADTPDSHHGGGGGRRSRVPRKQINITRVALFRHRRSLRAHHDTVQPRDAGRPVPRPRGGPRAACLFHRDSASRVARSRAHARRAEALVSPRRRGSPRFARRAEGRAPPPTPRRPSGPGGPVRSRRRRRTAAPPADRAGGRRGPRRRARRAAPVATRWRVRVLDEDDEDAPTENATVSKRGLAALRDAGVALSAERDGATTLEGAVRYRVGHDTLKKTRIDGSVPVVAAARRATQFKGSVVVKRARSRAPFAARL